MSRHEQPAAAPTLASTVLPSAEVIHLSTVSPSSGSFTRASINKMHCPPGKSEALFWDTACRGFGMRALKSGRRSWIYQYRDEHKRTRRVAIGDVSAVSLDTARAVGPSLCCERDARCQSVSAAQGEAHRDYLTKRD